MADFVECFYKDDMFVNCVHPASKASVVTDSRHIPGNYLSFTPTDLVAAGVLSCSLSIIAAYSDAREIDVQGMYGKAKSTVTPRPYRMDTLEMDIYMPDKPYTDRQKKGIEKVIEACPAHRSLHPDVKQVYRFHWADEQKPEQEAQG